MSRPPGLSSLSAAFTALSVLSVSVVTDLSPPGSQPRLNSTASTGSCTYSSMRAWEAHISSARPARPASSSRARVRRTASGWMSKPYTRPSAPTSSHRA